MNQEHLKPAPASVRRNWKWRAGNAQSSLNSNPGSGSQLEARYGRVWSHAELTRDFEVIGFAAPYVVVRRSSDSTMGSLEFQHHPRFYFNFELDQPA